MTEKYHTVGVLLEALEESGATWHSIDSLYRLERVGKITSPKLPNGRRVYTDSQIMEVIKAFSMGGVGEWHFKK